MAERLRLAAGDGRLDTDELGERLEAAFSARTYADLVPLTHDLPDGTAPLTHSPPSRTKRVGGRPGPRWSFAMMSGSRRRGRWVVPRRYTATTVMGGIELDLRDARLAGGPGEGLRAHGRCGRAAGEADALEGAPRALTPAPVGHGTATVAPFAILPPFGRYCAVVAVGERVPPDARDVPGVIKCASSR